MSKETRLNLIFLTLFLALTLPGAVILFKKKLDPSAPKMFEPDAVATRVPYMATQGVPPGTKYVVPPVTEAWVQGLVHDRAAGADPLSTGTPILTDDRRYQAVATSRGPTEQTLYLIAWDADAVGGLTATTLSPNGVIASATEIPVPGPIRQELKNYGLNHGSPRIGWIVARLTPPATQPASTTLTLQNPATGDSTFVNLFTR